MITTAQVRAGRGLLENEIVLPVTLAAIHRALEGDGVRFAAVKPE
jgi:hypothetical protein